MTIRKSVSSEGKSHASDTTEDSTSYGKETVLGAGYLLHLSCDQDAKLNGDFRISENGKIHLPYDVSLQAGGQKLSAFEKHLAGAYASYFNEHPRIRVSVKQKRYWIEVQGLVKAPGPYLVKERTTLDETLAMAGVRTEDLPSGFARIEQGGKSRWVSMEDYLKSGTTRELGPWHGGERILFQLERPEEITSRDSEDRAEGPSTRKVQVVGEVKEPGGVSFHAHEDGYYYLLQRGGPTTSADLGKVEVVRTDKHTGQHIRLSMTDISDIKNVQESDVLIVHPDRPSSFEKTLQNSALVASIISAIALTVLVIQNK